MNAIVIPIAGVGLFVLASAFVDPAVAAALIAALVFTRVPALLLHSESVLPAVLAVVLGVAASSQWRRRGARSNRRALAFGVAALAYLAVIATSYLWASDLDATASSVQQLALIIPLCVGFIATLHDTRALRWTAGAIIGAGAALALLSLHQAATGGYQRTYGGFAVAQIENIVGVTNAYRIGGPFGDPNYFGQLMVLPVAFALQRLVATRSLAGRVLMLAAIGLCGATVLLTYSRGALIALVVVVAVWIWTTASRSTRGVILACAIGVAVLGSLTLPSTYRDRVSHVRDVIPGIENKSNDTSDSALRGRQSATIVGWRMFADHPLVGVGAGNFPAHYLDYATHVGLYRSGKQLAPHSLVTEVASETGLVGVIVFGSIVVGAFAAVGRARKRFVAMAHRDDAQLVAAIRNALTGYLVASLFLHAAYPQMLWLLLALAWATPQCLPTPTMHVVAARDYEPEALRSTV